MTAQFQPLRLAAGGVLEPTNPAWPLTINVVLPGTLPASPQAGELAYDGSSLQYYSGSVWVALGTSTQVNSDWDATSGVAKILNKPTIPSISGLVPYSNASGPISLNGQNLTNVGSFAAGVDGQPASLDSGGIMTDGAGGLAVAIAGVRVSNAYAFSVNIPGTVGGTSLDNGHITTDGNGHLSAVSFVGGGANLTGISHTQVSGLGTAATHAATDFQTAITTGTNAQYFRGDLSLATFPTIPAGQVQTDWNASSGMGVLLNKPTNLSAFTNGPGFLTSSTGVTTVNGSSGAITNVTTLGNTVNSTTGTSLVETTAAGKYPALDGSLITNLSCANLAGTASAINVSAAGASPTLGSPHLIHASAESASDLAMLVLAHDNGYAVSNWPNAFLALEIAGINVTSESYPSALGATNDAGKVLVLAQGNVGSLTFITEMLVGAYSDIPVSLFANNQIIATFAPSGVTFATAYHGTLQTPSIASNAVTVDFSTGNVQKLTLPNGTTTAITIANVSSTQRCLLWLYQDSTGGALATWSGVDVWQGAAGAPTLTATASRIDIIGFVSDGTNVAGMLSPNFG